VDARERSKHKRNVSVRGWNLCQEDLDESCKSLLDERLKDSGFPPLLDEFWQKDLITEHKGMIVGLALVKEAAFPNYGF